MGYLFLLPIRRLWESPSRLFKPWVEPGDRIVDLGSGMGYLSLPLARMVGARGHVFAADVEPLVLERLRARARRAGLSSRLTTRVCRSDSPGLEDLDRSVDLVVAHHVIHETGDPARVLGRLAAVLRPGGKLWLAEPKGHVSAELFAWEVAVAREAGLEPLASPVVRRNMVTVLERPE